MLRLKCVAKSSFLFFWLLKKEVITMQTRHSKSLKFELCRSIAIFKNIKAHFEKTKRII